MLIAGAHASGLTAHLLIEFTAPGAGAGAVQLLVSNSRDSITAPLGHSFVIVRNFEPIIPLSHAVMVEAIGILYGSHANWLVSFACAMPPAQNASNATLILKNFKRLPFDIVLNW
ncbi:hypothetical protein [Massilia sp. LjRoot122]|uniref:hypothetical protein n=1 Tax=Massilia sp. LjRoot122 TaxID=3342257 RepID=UPI003ED13368